MSAGAIIVIMALFAQAICFPEVRNGDKMAATFPAPANLSYDELVYILQVRSGGEVKTPKTLSPCARAILGCCREKVMNEYCSESLKCGAFFFDVNPCEDKFVIDALSAARAFYEQFNNV